MPDIHTRYAGNGLGCSVLCLVCFGSVFSVLWFSSDLPRQHKHRTKQTKQHRTQAD